MLDAFFISVAVLPLVALVIFIALTATDGFRESASTRDAEWRSMTCRPFLCCKRRTLIGVSSAQLTRHC